MSATIVARSPCTSTPGLSTTLRPEASSTEKSISQPLYPERLDRWMSARMDARRSSTRVWLTSTPVEP